MTALNAAPVAIFRLPAELWDLVQKNLPSIKDRVNASLAFRDTRGQTRSLVEKWVPEWSKMIEEADIKANILNNENLVLTYAEALNIAIKAWTPMRIKPSMASSIAQHNPALRQYTYNQLRRHQRRHGISKDGLNKDQREDQARLKEELLFPTARSAARERACAVFLFNNVRREAIATQVCQARLCRAYGGDRRQQHHDIKFCDVHLQEHIYSGTVSFKQLADFCIRIIPNDTEPGGVLSWTVPFLSTDSRNAFESLSFAEADVITLGIYGLRWVELQRRRKAWSRELRERKGKEYSACIEALRVLRDWTYAGMDRTSGERTISGEMLADDFPWDLAPAFRAATGEDLRSMPKIVELLRHLGSQYQASPAATVDEYRLESAYRITKKEQLWANEAARKWIKPKLDSLGWIPQPRLCNQFQIVADKSFEPLVFTRKFNTPTERSYCTTEEAEELCNLIHGQGLDTLLSNIDYHTRRRNLAIYLHLQVGLEVLETQTTPGIMELSHDLSTAVRGRGEGFDTSSFAELPPFKPSTIGRKWILETAQDPVNTYVKWLEEMIDAEGGQLFLARTPDEVDQKHLQPFVQDFWKHSTPTISEDDVETWLGGKVAELVLDETSSGRYSIWEKHKIDEALSGPWREILECVECDIFHVKKGFVDGFAAHKSEKILGTKAKPFCCGRVLWFDESQLP